MKPLFWSLALFSLAGLSSCGDAPLYSQFYRISGSDWHRDSIVQFDVPIENIKGKYVIEVHIRHGSEYAYRNIYMGRRIVGARGIEYQDTSEVQLASPEGEWLGTGLGGIKTQVVPFKGQLLQFKKKGVYRFQFQQVMRDNPLVGIRQVGLVITSVDASR